MWVRVVAQLPQRLKSSFFEEEKNFFTPQALLRPRTPFKNISKNVDFKSLRASANNAAYLN